MKKAIITGADGFVGSNTVNEFLSQGVEVLAIDLPGSPARLTKNDNLRYVSCDVNDLSGLKEELSEGGYDTFVHFAWEGSAGPLRADYNIQVKNALITVELMKLAKEIGCKRFVGAGSIMEREVAAAIGTQGSKPGAGYIYGIGKYLAHMLCKTVAAETDIELVWAMITNAYGIGELSPRFVNNTLRKIINNEPLQFTAATQNYDFVYISDVAKAFYRISAQGKPFREYLIGSGNAKPLKEFIIEMRDELAPNLDLLFGDIPFTGTDLPLACFDTTDTRNDTGFVPAIGFAQGTKMTMEWLKSIEENKQ